ncbi:uncharacterized protein LOC130809200 [Amaranthus tricolor]|uniref:uncharacterized protein LOC130809200 n=1 Tax=Amaranthus tricolor TaxID=29722 RepID=UPI002588E1E5|nr:uncharacterized protein LOC130809200 [Amaranthus tricolor]
MEDSFRVRLDKIFGSLSSSSSSQSLPSSSLWCLTDEEIEKRQWTRESDASFPTEEEDDDDNNGFLPSNVDHFFFTEKNKLMVSEKNPNSNPNPSCSNDSKEFEDDVKECEDDEGEGKSSLNRIQKIGGDDEDELDVRNSIGINGMDCTLDFEEEEDGYDKMAVGKEKAGDRLHMSDVTDYTPHLNYNELPNTLRDVSRDPRADHLAAKLRLKEDAEAARSFNSLHVSDQTEDGVSVQNNVAEDEDLPKPILKRKDDQMDSKAGKRVRFDASCKTHDHSASEGDKIVVSEASHADNCSLEEYSSLQHNSSLVPDYVRHPLRYTHYTFDSSSDMNEESNYQAYTDFLKMVKKSKSEADEVPADLTKPVIFNRKKKAGDDFNSITDKTGHIKEKSMEEPVQKKSIPLSIAAGNPEEYEVSEMEVDELETTAVKIANGKRTARKYRSKVAEEINEPDN